MTEREWLTNADGRQLRVIEEHATERKLRLIAAALVRRLKLESEPGVTDDVIWCDDVIEAGADEPRSWDEVETVLRTRPGESWRCAHILARQGLHDVAKEVRRLFAFYGVSQPYFLRDLIHEVIGNPFRPVSIAPAWRTSTVLALAEQIYATRDFTAMPILADALQDAGCDATDILNHCRAETEHVRGCWVVDLLLGKS